MPLRAYPIGIAILLTEYNTEGRHTFTTLAVERDITQRAVRVGPLEHLVDTAQGNPGDAELSPTSYPPLRTRNPGSNLGPIMSADAREPLAVLALPTLCFSRARRLSRLKRSSLAPRVVFHTSGVCIMRSVP